MDIETWREQETSVMMMTLTIMKYLAGFFFSGIFYAWEDTALIRETELAFWKVSTLGRATDTKDTTTFVTSAPLQLLSGQANLLI